MKCAALNSAGFACSAQAVTNAPFCIMHSGRATELGRKGGENRGPELIECEHVEIAAPRTVEELCEVIARAIADVRAHRLEPKIASTMGYLGGVLLKAIETADLEKRLSAIEIALNQGKQS